MTAPDPAVASVPAEAVEAAAPMKIWFCKIGEVSDQSLSPGSDFPMREAVERAYEEVTGQVALFTFSGWGGALTESERAVVEDRLPDFDVVASEDVATLRAEIECLRTNLRAQVLAEVEAALRDPDAFPAWERKQPRDSLRGHYVARSDRASCADYLRDTLTGEAEEG